MATVQKKRRKNKDKLKSLGLIPKSPKTPRSASPKKTSPKKSNKKNTSPPKNVKDRPKKRPRSSRKIFEDVGIRKKCQCDHKDISSFKEETDKRYFQDEGELFETSCATCGVRFARDASDDGEAMYIPDLNNPAYFCIGRWKYGCKHGHCMLCYLDMLNSHSKSRSRRNK